MLVNKAIWIAYKLRNIRQHEQVMLFTELAQPVRFFSFFLIHEVLFCEVTSSGKVL